MANLNEFESFRIIRSLVHKPTRNSLDETQAALDYVAATPGVMANKWLEKQYSLVPTNQLRAEYLEADGSKKPFADLTPNLKGAIGMDFVRGQMRNVGRTVDVPGQVEATRESAKQASDDDAKGDWGDPEAGGGTP